MHIEAHEVEFSSDRVATAAFRGPASRYLVLSRDLEPTEQDRRLSHDEVHIEIDDQLHSTYGGVAFGSFGPTRLDLALTNRSSANVGTTTIAVSFVLPSERVAALRSVIRLLFERHSHFTIAA